MSKKISIIDTGASNLHSVFKAMKFIGADVDITSDENVIEASQAVIFPGVGAFGAVIDSVDKSGLRSVIKKSAESGKPFLGICVGLQALFDDSEEMPGVNGLSVFKGKVIKFRKAKRVPHIGWNEVFQSSGGSVQESAKKDKFYFVHSYYVEPEDKNLISLETEYDGENFPAAIKKDNLQAVQFHPEKSGEIGLELLKSFVNNV